MKTRNLIALGVLFAIIAGLAFLQTPIMEHARAGAWSAVVRSVGRISGAGIPRDERSVQDQLSSLQAENLRLKAELQDYRRFRAQLGTPAFENLRAIPAAVVGRPLDTFHSQYLLNKGLADGILLNAPVVLNGSVLVGFIREVTQHTSTVELLLHPNTRLAVETVNEDEGSESARGLLESRHFTSLLLTTVPRDREIMEGQSVVTIQKEAEIPFGLLVGRITKILSPEYEAYQRALLELPYDPDAIDAVHVLAAP